MNQEVKSLVKSVAVRFAKGGISGSVAAVTALSIAVPNTWHDAGTALTVLVYSVVTGFITGGLLAIEKAYNWTEVPPTQ